MILRLAFSETAIIGSSLKETSPGGEIGRRKGLKNLMGQTRLVIPCLLHAGVAESADASDLSENLSARRETGDAELLKVGEPCNVAIPSQARLERPGRCRD